MTDSALTNHGVLQANRLGSHISSIDTVISHIFCSDLRRAFLTADAIREAQYPFVPDLTKLELLREQDFGLWEGMTYSQRPRFATTQDEEAYLLQSSKEPGFRKVETKEEMNNRMEKFVDDHLLDKIRAAKDDETVAVVAHGIILSHLWKVFLGRFPLANVAVTSDVQQADRGFSLAYIGMWSNTGFLDLEVKLKQKAVEHLIPGQADSPTASASSPQSDIIDFAPTTSAEQAPTNLGGAQPPSPVKAFSLQTSSILNLEPLRLKLLDMSLVVKAVNSQPHLKGLKKTRGGIGSLAHDNNQRTMDHFFKRRKLG